jgi:hypothetical protein
VFQDQEVVGSLRSRQESGTYGSIGYTGQRESGERVLVQDSDGDGELDIRWVYPPGGQRSTMQVHGNDTWYTFKCEGGTCGFLVNGELKSADELGFRYPSGN